MFTISSAAASAVQTYKSASCQHGAASHQRIFIVSSAAASAVVIHMKVYPASTVLQAGGCCNLWQACQLTQNVLVPLWAHCVDVLDTMLRRAAAVRSTTVQGMLL